MNAELIQEYNPKWALYFLDIKNILLSKIGDFVIDIHHVGSTSVPNLPAKAIIDIDIEIEDYGIFPTIINKLAELGYCHKGDLGIPQREAFGRKSKMVPTDGSGREWIDHHLYVCPKTSNELKRHLKFRDSLRTNDAIRKEYAEIKRKLAKEANNNREEYAKLKEIAANEFILKYSS